jgi:hypothetical protein
MILYLDYPLIISYIYDILERRAITFRRTVYIHK